MRALVNIHTWRRLTLTAMIVADKVYEDYAIWNTDVLPLFPHSSAQDLKSLERWEVFLDVLFADFRQRNVASH